MTAVSVGPPRLELQAGIVAGLVCCVSYPLLVFVPLPRQISVVLAAAFGPALTVASWGLRTTLHRHTPSLLADLAFVSNTVAGALFSSMLLVQLATAARAEGTVPSGMKSVWLGLDVAWDVYLALGTTLFAVAMAGHPRFGLAFASTGVVIGASLAALNLYTFPMPPADADLVDLGPLVGAWYLATTLAMWRSLRWASVS